MAAFDPENPSDLKSLCRSIEASHYKLRGRREQRITHLKQFVGKYYGEDGAPDKVPINLIELGITVFQQFIAPRNPQGWVESVHRDLAPGAADLELALNHEVERVRIADSLEMAGLESLFCLGTAKVGIVTAQSPAEPDGYQCDPGKLFVDPVLFEDLILDMTAKRRDHMQYVGDEFVTPYEWVMDNRDFPKELRDKLTKRGEEGLESNKETDSNQLSTGNSATIDQFRDTIRLRQVFLPGYNLILLMAKDIEDKPLQIIEWKGPEQGPYHFLGHGMVPGNLIPPAPVPYWYDLHDITNRLYNKAARQAERQKTLVGVPGHAKDDGQRVLEHSDGDMIYLENPGDIKEFSTGGVDQRNLAMVIWGKQMQDFLAGNISSLGGLAAQTKTVGQDKLLVENASGRPKRMAEEMITFTGEILRDCAWWMWHDPLSEFHLIKQVDGADYGIPVTWSPESRMGDFFDYNIKVNPYSMTSRSPSERGSALMQYVQEMLIPTIPMRQQQGQSVDWEAIDKAMAKYLHLPELKSFSIYAAGEAYPEREPPGMPKNTTRTNIRENRPAPTQNGSEQVLMRSLMSGMDSQGSEVDGMMRTA